MNTPNVHNPNNAFYPAASPVAEPSPGVAQVNESVANTTEQQPNLPRPEIAPQATTSPNPIPNQPATNSTTLSQSAPTQASSVHTDAKSARDMFAKTLESLPAEDVDLIEKSWVKKTEDVIEQDKDDPALEDEHQHEMSRVYIKKRFNLDVN